MSNQWVYITDLAPSATIRNLETGHVRTIMSNSVKDRAPNGLRRTIIEELPGGMFQETNEVLPLTVDLAEEIEEYYNAPNSWNYDWPHLPTEHEDTPEARERLTQQLLAQMGEVPFEFTITGLQRRFLMYFSDGNMTSQKRFERFIPAPVTSPFNRNWDLRPRYAMYYNSIMRDASAPHPPEMKRWGNGRPCLYVGPAWTLRFQIDGQDPLLERCRVYVDDEGTFIGSDWCQRHDFSSYQGGGINLQMGIYTLSSWIMGPCLTYNQQHGGVTLKSTTYKVEKVRELLKKPQVVVPTFEDTFTKAQQLIQQFVPHIVEQSAAAAAMVDAGPITVDVIKEADAAYAKALEQILVKRAGLEAEPVTARAVPGNTPATVVPPSNPNYRFTVDEWHVYLIDDDALGGVDTLPFTVAYRQPTEDPNDIQALRIIDTLVDKSHLTHQLQHFDAMVEEGEFRTERFYIDSNSNTGFWYLGEGDDLVDVGEDALNNHWWLYAAARYYRDVAQYDTHLNSLAKAILETA